MQSRQYGLRILHINTSEETRAVGDIEYNTVFNRATKRLAIQGRNWDSSPLSFETEIISDTPIRELDQDAIKGWLFNRPTFAKFYTDETKDDAFEVVDGEQHDVYIECVFYNPTAILYAGGVFGWKCQCMTSSPMAIQETIIKTLSGGASQPIDINVETDISDYTYPVMVITGAATSGDIEIRNLTDNRVFRVIDVPSSCTLYVDNALGTITDDTGVSFYDRLADRKFLRFLPGVNQFEFNDNIQSVQFRWNNARWFR